MSRLPAPPAANLPATNASENPDEAEAKLLEQLRELDELHTRVSLESEPLRERGKRRQSI
jgi:hypothetical protein